MRSEDFILRKNKKEIRGRLYLPECDGQKKVPLVIFCHGLGSNYRELEHYGPFFAKRGIACCLFDFCGGGPESLSSGSFREMSVKTEQEDLNLVLDEMKTRTDFDREHIFLMGESLGGYVAACTAAERQAETAGLILWYPAFHIREEAEKHAAMPAPEKYTFFGFRLGEAYIRDALAVPVDQVIAAYRKNVLLIHGDRDDLVPLSVSEKAARIFASARLEVIPGAGHGFEGDDRWRAAGYSADFISDQLTRSDRGFS